MNYNGTDSRVTIAQVIRRSIDSALVEEVFTPNSRTGYILISYAVQGENNSIQSQFLRLNVGWETILENQFGEAISLCTIRQGMLVNAEFSAYITRSDPPQTNAIRIVAQVEQPVIYTTTELITMVDVTNGFLYTESPDNGNEQSVYAITSMTEVLDQDGNLLLINSLRPGQLVRVEYTEFQTPDLLSQAVAFRIQML